MEHVSYVASLLLFILRAISILWPKRQARQRQQEIKVHLLISIDCEALVMQPRAWSCRGKLVNTRGRLGCYRAVIVPATACFAEVYL